MFLHKKKMERHSFTLVEIIVSMSIFALLSLITMQIFNSMQNLWASTANRTQTFQNARSIMDMIETDIQCVYYNQETGTNNWNYKLMKSGDELSELWLVTNRQNSVQAKRASLVEVCYWVESFTKDGVALKRLKMGTISNVTSNGTDIIKNTKYNFRETAANDDDFPKPADVENPSVLSDNILSIKVAGYNNNGTSHGNDSLPNIIVIQMDMLDDDQRIRAKSEDDRESLKHHFSRVIQINHNQ